MNVVVFGPGPHVFASLAKAIVPKLMRARGQEIIYRDCRRADRCHKRPRLPRARSCPVA